MYTAMGHLKKGDSIGECVSWKVFKGTKSGVRFQPAGTLAWSSSNEFCKSVYSAGAAAHVMDEREEGELPGTVLAQFMGRKRTWTFYEDEKIIN